MNQRSVRRQPRSPSHGRTACGTRLLDRSGSAGVTWRFCRLHHRCVIFSVACQLTRCLLDCLMLLTRRETSRDTELLVLRHENAVLRRQAGRTLYEPDDRLWLAALSRLIPRHQWNKVFPVTPATILA